MKLRGFCSGEFAILKQVEGNYMVLYKLNEYDPDYKDAFHGKDILSFDVYGQDDDKVGSVKNVMVDEEDRLRYFIVDTGFWIFGKNILLPVGMTRIDFDDNRVYAPTLTKQQVEDLPEFTENLKIDNDYEEQIRGIYRPSIAMPAAGFLYSPMTYNYALEPYFYEMNEPYIRDYEERRRARRNPNRADTL